MKSKPTSAKHFIASIKRPIDKIRAWLAPERQIESRDELIQLLREAEVAHLINNTALSMLEGVMQVGEMQARDIMIPRSQMTVIERDMKLADILPVVIDATHSRYPVVGESRDEVVGILLAKDLLAFSHTEHDDAQFNLQDMLRPAIMTPESKRLSALLQDFQSTRNHMAVVVDEYGMVSGLVTIEDVLEQIVGEIEDEHDFDETDFIKQHGAHEFIIKALTPLEDFNQHFEANLTSESDTIGGYLLGRFGHMPKRGESINVGAFQFTILHADKRRIRLVKMLRLEDTISTDA